MKQPAPALVIGIVAGTFWLTTGLLLIGEVSTESGSIVLGMWCSVGFCALGVVHLSAGGLLPDVFRLWAGGVLITWLALMVLGFCVVKVAVAREKRKNNQANALPHRADDGWTLALVLMLFGVLAVLWAIKCLVFGPPPYSLVAYVIGPVLIAAGYLVDRNPILHLLNDCRKPPEPPAAEGGGPAAAEVERGKAK